MPDPNNLGLLAMSYPRALSLAAMSYPKTSDLAAMPKLLGLTLVLLFLNLKKYVGPTFT
jgi:hypothetical protein